MIDSIWESHEETAEQEFVEDNGVKVKPTLPKISLHALASSSNTMSVKTNS